MTTISVVPNNKNTHFPAGATVRAGIAALCLTTALAGPAWARGLGVSIGGGGVSVGGIGGGIRSGIGGIGGSVGGISGSGGNVRGFGGGLQGTNFFPGGGEFG